MDYILYIFRALYRKMWWIILGTALVTGLVIYKTKGMRGGYNVESTLYTGVVSGYSIEENNAGVNWAIAQNAIDNLIHIIESESTLKRVSMRLFARVLVKGSPDRDQNEITAASYNYTYNHMKAAIMMMTRKNLRGRSSGIRYNGRSTQESTCGHRN